MKCPKCGNLEHINCEDSSTTYFLCLNCGNEFNEISKEEISKEEERYRAILNSFHKELLENNKQIDPDIDKIVCRYFKMLI